MSYNNKFTDNKNRKKFIEQDTFRFLDIERAEETVSYIAANAKLRVATDGNNY
jgi:hypothetical protein